MVMVSTNEPKQEKDKSIKRKSNLAAAFAVEEVAPLLLLRAIEELPMCLRSQGSCLVSEGTLQC